MSRKSFLPKSNSLMNVDLTMSKSMTIKSEKDTDSRSMETSTETSSSTVTDERKNECLSKKLVKSSSAIIKPTHKHKHRCHHHHHHHRQQLVNKTKKPVTIIREMSNNDNQTNDERTANKEQQPSSTDTNQVSESKKIKGNIPLQPVENKLVSQRKAPVNETQVGNCSSVLCNQCLPTICNTTTVQQVICEEECCMPPVALSCTCSSCVLPQSNSVVCFPQQQQQQQQQQQILVYNDPYSTAQPLLCVPETSLQQSPTIIIQPQQQQQQQPSIQILQSPGTSSVQYIQVASATPQIMQASPQILYQRPYDPIVIPVQNQQIAIAQNPAFALSQPSYAPARQVRTGPFMFQNALVQAVSDRTGVPFLMRPTGGFQQVAQSPFAGSPMRPPLGSTARPLSMNHLQQSASLPLVPLSPGGLLIPFQASQPSNTTPGGNPPPRVGFPPGVSNMADIRQRLQQRAQALASLRQQNSIVNQPSPRLPLLLADPSVPRPSPPSLPLPSLNSRPAFSMPFAAPQNFTPLPQLNPRPAFPMPSAAPQNFTPLPQLNPPPQNFTPLPQLNPRPAFPMPSAAPQNFTPLPQLNPRPAYSVPSATFPNSSFPSNPIVPPPLIQSQTPYMGGNRGDVSDTSSSGSRSSASSTAPARRAPAGPSGLIYSQPSIGGSIAGSGMGGLAPTYQSV